MKHYGLTIAEGSEITNATVATGTSFPGNESVGELFFRTDQTILYVWDGSEWDPASPTVEPAGSDTQVQYNDNGSFGASANLTFDSNILRVGVTPVVIHSNTVSGGNADLRLVAGADSYNVDRSHIIVENNGGLTLRPTAGNIIGTDSDAGDISLTGADGDGTGQGSDLLLTSGDGGSTGGRGGAMDLQAGHSYGPYHGRDVNLFGGDAFGTGDGGGHRFRAGRSSTGLYGADIQTNGGSDDDTCGGILLDGSISQAADDQDSGLVTIRTGQGGSDGGGGGGSGGTLQLIVGASFGTQDGSPIILSPGSAAGSGEDGHVLVKASGGSAVAPLRFREQSPNLNYIEIKCPLTIATSRSWTLPEEDPTTAWNFLTTDTSGVWEFTNQLSANLDVNGSHIVNTVTNGDLNLVPDGTGAVHIPVTDYENNVNHDDDVPNKKYVDDAIAAAGGGGGGGTVVAKLTMYEYTATAGQTTFSGSDDNGETLTYTTGELVVFQNGTMLDPDDYTATSGTSVVLNTGAGLGHEINILRIGAETSSAIQPLLYEFTATEGQTTFSGTDDNAEAFSYSVGELLVFKNGILLDPDDYTATNGTSVVLDSGASAGDEVNILRYITVDRFNTLRTYRYLLDDGDDTASGVDAKGHTLSYAINLLNVYLNGSKVSEDEYTATDSSSVVLDTPVTGNNHILEIQTFSTFTSIDEVTARENLIINGNMRIWQRNTSFTGISSEVTADRWRAIDQTGTGAHDVARSTDVPNGSRYSLAMTTTTGDAVLDGAEYATYLYTIEGSDIQTLSFGNVDAVPLTLSFYVKSSVSGVHNVSFRNSAGDRSYVVEYTVDSADTWERKTVTIPGCPDGTWATDAGAGFQIFWCLGAGPTLTTSTTDAWVNGNFIAGSNHVNAVATTNNVFRISQVRLEVGTRASAFRDRLIGDELALCHRYFFKTYRDIHYAGQASTTGCLTNMSANDGDASITAQFPVRMRAIPTVTAYNPNNGTSGQMRVGSTNRTVAASYVSERSAAFRVSGGTTNATVQVHCIAEAEL